MNKPEIKYASFKQKTMVSGNRYVFDEKHELIIPDRCPDAERVIDCSGRAHIKNISSNDSGNRVIFDISTSVAILYRAESGDTNGFANELETTVTINAEAPAGSCVFGDVTVRSCDVQLINSRKLTVGLSLAGNYSVYSDSSFDYAVDKDDPDILCLYESSAPAPLAAVSRSLFTINDELELGEDKPLINLVLSKELCFSVSESKTVNDKIIVRANANVKFNYLSVDSTIETAEFNLPFTQVFDIPGVDEDSIVKFILCPNALDIEPRQTVDSDRLVEITLSGCANIRAYIPVEINYISDIFCLSSETNAETRLIRPAYNADLLRGESTLRETIEFNRNPDRIEYIGATLSSCSLFIKDESSFKAQCEVYIDILYTSEGGLYSLNRKFNVEWSGNSDGVPLFAEAHKSACKLSSPVNKKCDLELSCGFDIHYEKQTTLPLVGSIEFGESVAAPTSSIILTRLSKPLLPFELGKKYRVPPDDIITANGLQQGEALEAGRLTVIPSFRKS